MGSTPPLQLWASWDRCSNFIFLEKGGVDGWRSSSSFILACGVALISICSGLVAWFGLNTTALERSILRVASNLASIWFDLLRGGAGVWLNSLRVASMLSAFGLAGSYGGAVLSFRVASEGCLSPSLCLAGVVSCNCGLRGIDG